MFVFKTMWSIFQLKRLLRQHEELSGGQQVPVRRFLNELHKASLPDWDVDFEGGAGDDVGKNIRQHMRQLLGIKKKAKPKPVIGKPIMSSNEWQIAHNQLQNRYSSGAFVPAGPSKK
jgi:hypothetical protein